MNEYVFSMENGRRVSIQLPYEPEQLITLLNKAWTEEFVLFGNEIINVEKIACVEIAQDERG